MHYWFNGGHMIWMGVSWIILFGFFAALVWLLFSAARDRTPSADSAEPEAILRRRYAAGEIEADEYERRLAELRKTKDAA